MIVAEPKAEVYFHMPLAAGAGFGELYDLQGFTERIGRTCYKSEDKIAPGSAAKFIDLLKKRGHHAMLEHCVASADWVCDRGVSHELVRHRLAVIEPERQQDFEPPECFAHTWLDLGR